MFELISETNYRETMEKTVEPQLASIREEISLPLDGNLTLEPKKELYRGHHTAQIRTLNETPYHVWVWPSLRLHLDLRPHREEYCITFYLKSNMTGNIVILGMGVAGADELPVLGPAVALAAFTAGAFAAGLTLRVSSARGRQERMMLLLLLIGAAALIALTGGAMAVGDHAGALPQAVMAAATAAVMGQQAMVARALAVKDMTTVVVTSTLASRAGETWAAAAPGRIVNRRAGAILVIFAGAVAGALMLRVHLAVPFGVAAALTVAVVVGIRRAQSRQAQPTTPKSPGDAAKADVGRRAVL